MLFVFIACVYKWIEIYTASGNARKTSGDIDKNTQRPLFISFLVLAAAFVGVCIVALIDTSNENTFQCSSNIVPTASPLKIAIIIFV